jgi:hypothetical protein
MSTKELIDFIKKEREKVNWLKAHQHPIKWRYDMEEKLFRAIDILRLKAEPKARLP